MASQENKALANYLRSRLSPHVTVQRFHDSRNVNSIDVLSAPNTPKAGVEAYATVNFSDHSIDAMVDGVPLRVELLMAAYPRFGDAVKMLCSCAFNRINAGLVIGPDLIYANVVKTYMPKSPMTSVMLVAPFSWTMETQHFPSKVVAWLQLLPISDAETQFAANNSPDELQDLLERSGIDAFDLNRRSVL